MQGEVGERPPEEIGAIVALPLSHGRPTYFWRLSSCRSAPETGTLPIADTRTYRMSPQCLTRGSKRVAARLPYCSDFGSERFFGVFLFNSEINSCAAGGALTFLSRIMSFALSFWP